MGGDGYAHGLDGGEDFTNEYLSPNSLSNVSSHYVYSLLINILVLCHQC